MALLTEIAQHIRGLVAVPLRRKLGSRRKVKPHASITTVQMAADLPAEASRLGRLGEAGFRETLRGMRELYELSTPALYLHIVTGGQPCRVVLVPWDRRQVSFSGPGWHLLAGVEAPSGVEAFIVPRGLRTPLLYSNAPDHPVFVVALRVPGQHEFRGYIPPYVTHVTIVADGREVVSTQRLAHDAGARVFQVDGRAA
jgi:hypothetical protein